MSSTTRVQPLQPNSLCYPSEIGPCSSAGQPTGVSVPTAPYPQAQAPTIFTVDQATARIRAAGYTRVSGLQQDWRGNWNGKAVKDGRTVPVTLDFNGNVNNTANVTGGGLPRFYDRAFTVDQAISQIEARGYSAVTQLKKDNHGNWHGKAVKGGHSVNVTLNYNGSIESKKQSRDTHPHHEGPSLG
jgi:hypothetical protein